jgi:Phage integrase, N-terminal SAM-like domain
MELLNERDISKWLSHLATERHVAASAQNQALSAILFLYGDAFSFLPLTRPRRSRMRGLVMPRVGHLAKMYVTKVRVSCFITGDNRRKR